MDTQIEELPNITCIRPKGRLDFEAAAGFQPVVEQAIAAAAKRKVPVVIECTDLHYVSSAGLRVFLVAARSAKASSIALLACALSAPVKEVFDVSGFGRIVEVQPDLAAVLAKVTSASS